MTRGPVCVSCWRSANPGRRLAETNAGIPKDETCVRCGASTRSGLSS